MADTQIIKEHYVINIHIEKVEKVYTQEYASKRAVYAGNRDVEEVTRVVSTSDSMGGAVAKAMRYLSVEIGGDSE